MSVRLVASAAVLAATLGARSSSDTQRAAGPPPYCATRAGGDDADIWQLVLQPVE